MEVYSEIRVPRKMGTKVDLSVSSGWQLEMEGQASAEQVIGGAQLL